jgi:hypothetical protein
MGTLKVTSQHFREKVRKIMENYVKSSRYSGREWNTGLPEYEIRISATHSERISADRSKWENASRATLRAINSFNELSWAFLTLRPG